MTKKQKKVLIRIIVAAILLVILHFVPLEGLWLGLLYLIPYAVIGYDILRKAVLGIMHGEVFDENFLMAVATVGAMGLGEYSEGVAVMLFYQIGELFSRAVPAARPIPSSNVCWIINTRTAGIRKAANPAVGLKIEISSYSIG